MGTRSTLVILTTGAMFATAASIAAPVGASAHQRPVVSPAVHFDHSRPLREMRPATAVASRLGRLRALHGLPRVVSTTRRDGALQTHTNPGPSSLGAGSLNFAGVGNGFTGPAGTFTVQSAPPDTSGAVGPSNYVQIVNSDFAIFSKTGTAVLGPVPTNTLWSGFGGGCQTNNDGDGGVMWDGIANRWIIHQFSVSTTPYLECVAVSQTPDPTGAYFRYAFSYGTSDFPDYPKLAVWPDAYYATYNIFAGGFTFTGARACAFDRANMLIGAAATQQCFNTSASIGGALPATLDGTRLPPTGEPETVAALGAAANQLATYRFHVDWTTPANSTFTGPTNLATAAFSEACGGGTCIPQSGTTNQLDSLADRLMNRLVYRNFGDHEALLVNHAVAAGTGVGVRWYELRGLSGALSIFQQGTYAPDSSYRWMGSAAFDGAGDIAVGYSQSSSSVHPGIRISGRSAAAPPGTFSEPELTLFTGAGSQTGSLTRWGDYSQITVDPTDDCTFWYTNEYIPANGSFNWSTRIGTFKFSECPLPTGDDFSIAANPPSLSIDQGNAATSTIATAITSGSAQTISLSVAGAPAGVSASLSPTTITAGGSATLTVSVGGATPIGNSLLTVTGTGTSATHAVSIPLTVTAPSTGFVVNGGFETGVITPWKYHGPATVVSGGHTGAFQVRTGTTTVGTAKSANVNQTLVLPSGSHTLTLWYQLTCPDIVKHDWATVTVRDNTVKHTTTVVAKTCINDGLWHQVTFDLTPMAGHSVKITLTSHDDLVAGDVTYANWDDVTVT